MSSYPFIITLMALWWLAPFQGALAGDISWGGNYRFEALQVFNPSLGQGSDKSYLLHHLTLRPQIQAYDGLVIKSRFDLLNPSRFPNDQLGQSFGPGVNPSMGGHNAATTNTLGDQQASGNLAVNELYVNWVHEFGVLTVGRAPMHFGLGIQFNGGFGAFDHWLENRDLMAYKIVTGAFTFMPAFGKSFEGDLGQTDDINDYILQVNYENPDTNLAVGFLYQARRSGGGNSNDTPTPPFQAQESNGAYKVNSYNLYVSQWVDLVQVAFELGFHSGPIGLTTDQGQGIEHEAMGGVLELSYHPPKSPWGFNLNLGFASGDDPSTPETFEGYIFDQNYQVAFLLFNHPLGQADFFRTAALRGGKPNANAEDPDNPDSSPGASHSTEDFDTEALSNSLFISGAAHYKWSDHYDLEARMTYAQLDKIPLLNSNMESGVGFEMDLSLHYKPFKGFQWINRAGLFMPGPAFKGGSQNFPTRQVFGVETKAALSF